MKGCMEIKGTWKGKAHEKKSRRREKVKRTCLLLLSVILSAAVYQLTAGSIIVLAAPASLESSSAVVYEQASEGSNAVGNLIQDSTFDYLGDETAEDGSVWHRIVMANGVSGYIRGDMVLSPVETGETGTGTGAENEGTGTGAENGETGADMGAEGAGAEPGGEAEGAGAETGEEGAEAAGAEPAEDETAAQEDADDGQTGEGDALPGNGTQPVYQAENNRQKTYASGTAGTKIKQTESMSEPEEISEVSADTGFFSRLDRSLIFSGLVLLCSFLAGRFFWKKLKGECGEPGESRGNILKGITHRHDKKSMRRKRKNRRRKNKKKKQQAKKENEKTYKTSNGKRSGYTQGRKE